MQNNTKKLNKTSTWRQLGVMGVEFADHKIKTEQTADGERYWDAADEGSVAPTVKLKQTHCWDNVSLLHHSCVFACVNAIV